VLGSLALAAWQRHTIALDGRPRRFMTVGRLGCAGGKTSSTGRQDLQAGGSWLGVSRSGRVTVLTNYRLPVVDPEPRPSRGSLELPTKQSKRARLPEVSGAPSHTLRRLGTDRTHKNTILVAQVHQRLIVFLPWSCRRSMGGSARHPTTKKGCCHE
jgi:hypothetical protein